MEPAPLVSVVIPAKNAAATLDRAISSVLAQDYRPLEVIVVDDGSTDRTSTIAAGFGAPVRLLRNPRCCGAAAARNLGVAAARGDIIAFQDADDEWLPGKLSCQVAALAADPAVTFVACGGRLIDLEGRDRGALFGGRTPPSGTEAWRSLLVCGTIATPTVAARRAAFAALGGFDPSLWVAEDQDMWIRLALHGRLAYIDRHLVNVHVVRDSLSAVAERTGYRLQLAYTLPMIRRHVARQADRLSRREVRTILAERCGRVGRAAYTDGDYRQGLSLLIVASLRGFEPVTNLLFLVSALPPVRCLKRLIRGSRT